MQRTEQATRTASATTTPVATTSVITCDAVPAMDVVAARCRNVTEWCGATTIEAADGSRRLVARPVDGVTIEIDVVASPWSHDEDETAFLGAVADAGMPIEVASRVAGHRAYLRIRTTAARPDDVAIAAELGRDVTRSLAALPDATAWYSPSLGACVPTSQAMRAARVTQAA